MNTKRYRLTLELLEDLHTGTGTGSGDIDALQMRDRYGRPVIRASHLKGLLLAAGEELARFDISVKTNLQALLGSSGNRKGKLRLTSLRLDGDSPGNTVIWTSSARIKGERRSRDDTMRIVEHVAAGNRYTAELRLPADDAMEKLLSRLVARIDRLGGDRNRGAGLVCSRLDEIDGGKVETPTVSSSRLILRLKNREPLCLPDTGHPGNLIQSLPFIRGQVLRGALMAWALARDDKDALAALDQASIGDSLPLPPNFDAFAPEHVEVMPIPLSILSPKPASGETDLPWWAGHTVAADFFDDLGAPRPSDGEKPKRPGAREFLVRHGAEPNWVRYSPIMSVHLRNQSADLFDISGKPVAEPQLFSMEEIAEDTSFLGELRFPDTTAATAFARHFAPVLAGGEWLAIGREARPVEVATMENALPSASPIPEDDWTLTLTSDLVLRSPHLGFLTDLDIATLCAETGIEPQANWKIRGFAETVRLHGFNAASGLRRKSALAIRRGSCWRIDGPGSRLLGQALAKRAAIGDRTNEGLGRFAIDLQPIATLTKPEESAVAIQQNRQHEELLSAAKRIADHEGGLAPSVNQLQWLRSSALAAGAEGELDRLLDEVAAAPTRRKQGGKKWAPFPISELRSEVTRLHTLPEKRLLISHVVQWLVPKAKAKAQEKRS